MAVLYVLIPLALLLAGAGVLAFRWAVRSGQFDDVETPALRMLMDNEDKLIDGERMLINDERIRPGNDLASRRPS
ncbi:MAG: cbb3-type cytochrome oxidase assembly protein CcoS [Bacteroidota bacterium]